MGSDPDLRRNQMILRIESGTPEAVSNPFFRTLLFWHFHLGLAARLTLSLVFFAVLWMALTLWVLGRRSTAVPLIWLSAIALAVFASSSATTWYQERGEGDRPVIVAPGGAETGTFKN
jgi:hypothetical protein